MCAGLAIRPYSATTAPSVGTAASSANSAIPPALIVIWPCSDRRITRITTWSHGGSDGRCGCTPALLSHMMRPMRGALVIAVCLAAGCPAQPSTTRTQTESPAVKPKGPPSPSRLETKSFASTALGVDKNYVVYLPAGYDSEPDRRWPVFYYLHGLTGDETNWGLIGGMATAADKLALAAIVVMPDADDSFYADAVGPDYD